MASCCRGSCLCLLWRAHSLPKAKVSSWISAAVVGAHFHLGRVLLQRLPIAAHINKTYQEALNLNNRKVGMKWSNAHARLHNYSSRLKEGLVELWVHGSSSEALIVLLKQLFNIQTFIRESFFYLLCFWLLAGSPVLHDLEPERGFGVIHSMWF